jgi:hypothetical protein
MEIICERMNVDRPVGLFSKRDLFTRLVQEAADWTNKKKPTAYLSGGAES